MAGIENYVKESFEELRTNVTWTSWSEVQRLTIVVAVFSILFSLSNQIKLVEGTYVVIVF